MNDNELKITADPNGHLVIAFAGQTATLEPRAALTLAASITTLMSFHFPGPPATPAPAIAQPDRRILLPFAVPGPAARRPVAS